MPQHLSYFISSHGFGHAARAAAIMKALQDSEPRTTFSIFTKVPEWFFSDSGVTGFTYYPCTTDVGFAQTSPTAEDLSSTIAQLRTFVPFARENVQSLAALVASAGAAAVICDISPLGLAVAAEAGIPSVLIENFTWDWIYRGYPAVPQELLRFAELFAECFASATHHFQTAPVCAPAPRARQFPPVSRSPRRGRLEMRRELEIDDRQPVVLITMGGVSSSLPFLEQLPQQEDIATFVVAAPVDEVTRRGNVVLFPPRSELYHPDLVQMSDVVIGKTGYSTVCEAFYAGCGFGVVERPTFREHQVMEKFLRDSLPTLLLSHAEFLSGSWLGRLPELLERVARRESPVQVPPVSNGAFEVAGALHALLA